jgi:hypothetical protein
MKHISNVLQIIYKEDDKKWDETHHQCSPNKNRDYKYMYWTCLKIAIRDCNREILQKSPKSPKYHLNVVRTPSKNNLGRVSSYI